MLKKFFEWMEGDVSRGRKVALMGTIFIFLLLTITTFIIGYCGVPIQDNLLTVYVTFTTLMGSIFAFYTSTKASTDGSTEPAGTDKVDEAVGKILEKLKTYSEKL